MEMATVRSKAEMQYLDKFLGTMEAIQWGETVYRREPFWIGGRRKTLLKEQGDHHVWIWNDDEKDEVTCKRQWGKNLPDNKFDEFDVTFDEDCMQVKPKKFKGCTDVKCTGGGPYVWNDEYCQKSLRVVCEIRTCKPKANC